MPIPRPAYNEFASARAKPTPYEPPTDLPTLSYRQVLDMYDEDRKDQPVFSQMTLPEYAQYQNKAGESQMFDQATMGGVKGVIKRGFGELDKYIDSPAGVYGLVNPAAGLANQFLGGNKSLPTMFQEAAQNVASPLGEHWSSVIGEGARGIPEGAVNMAPMVFGGPYGIAASALLNAGSTYEKSGSGGQALLSGVTAGLVPSVFGKSAQAGLRLAGATLKNEAGQLVGETLGQRAAGYGAGQLGAAGLLELSHQTGQVAAGNGLDLSTEHFVQSAIGQLPFLALDLPNLINGGQIASAIKAKNATAERARQAEEYNLSIDQGGFRLSRNEEDARREGDRRPLQPDFQDLQVPPIQQSVYAPEFGNVDRPAVTGQPSEGSPEAAGEWALPSKTGPEPQRGKLLSRNEVDELKAQGEGDAVKSGKYEPAYDKTLFSEKLPSVKTKEEDRTHYGTTDKPVAKPGGGATEYTSDWQVGQEGETGKRVSTSEVLARQAAAYDQSKVEPKPLTPQVTESVIKPLLSETDSATAIKKIKGVYEAVLKPEFGVHDVVLNKLTDESLQQQILSHLQEGSGLNDAVLKTTQGIRNSLAEAAQKSEGKIITPEVKSIFAKIKAKQGQQLGSFPDVSIIGDYAEIGYHIAKNLLKAGALKLSEWRDTVVQTFKTEGIDLDDSQLSQLEQRMRSMLASEDSGDGDTLHTAQRARLTKSFEGLNHLDDAWNSLPEDQKGTTNSPLERATRIRDQILERDQKYSKYPEVDEGILAALGDLRHNGQIWLDKDGKPLGRGEASVRSYLEKAAKFAYKGATKKEQGGQEVAYDEEQTTQGEIVRKKLDSFKDINEAGIKADDLNRAVPQNADYSYEPGIVGRKEKNPKYVVYKTYKKRESLDENFRPSREQPDETDKLITDKEAVPTGEESDPTREGTNLDESLYKTTDEGEAIDPLEEIESIGDKVRASSDENSGDVVQQHLSDVFNTVLGRLDPIQLYLEGQVRKPGELVARTKLMVQHLMDARVDLDAKGLDWSKFVAEANPKLADEFKFQSDKQANNWWNGTGREFFKSWISKQPEIKSILGGKKAEAERVGSGPSVAEANKAREPKPDEVRLDAVSEARLTTTDFLRSYFSRRGLGPELSQRSTDAVQKLARAAAFFRGSERAEVRLDSLPPNVVGTAIDASIGGTWSPLIRLNKDITSDSFLSVVAGHESYETLLHAINRGEATTQATRSVQSAIEQATNYSVSDRRALLDVASRTLPKDVDRQLLSGLLDYSASDPKEFVSTLAGIHVVDSTTKGGLARFADTLLYGDGYISRALSSVVNTAQSLINAFRGVTSASREGLISDLTTPLKADLRHFNDLFKTVRNSEKTIQDAVSKLSVLDSMSPENALQTILNKGLPPPERTGDSEIDGAASIAYARLNDLGDPNEIGPLESRISDFGQLANSKDKVMLPIYGEMLSAEGLARSAGREIVSPLFKIDHVRGRVVPGEAKAEVQRVLDSSKLSAALDDQLHVDQTNERLSGPAELQALAVKHKLDPEERRVLAVARTAMADMNVHIAQVIDRGLQSKLSHSIARELMVGNDGTRYENAIGASERLLAIKQQSATNPVADPLSLLKSITDQYKIAPEKVIQAQLALEPLYAKYQEAAKFLKDKPWFATLRRSEEFQATYSKAGEVLPGRIGAKSRKDLEAQVAVLTKDPKITNIQKFVNSGQYSSEVNPFISNKIRELGDIAYSKLQFSTKEEAESARDGFSIIMSSLDKELTVRGLNKFTQQRKGSPGSESINLIQNTLKYATTIPYAFKNAWLADRASVALQDPTMVANPSAQEAAKRQVQAMLTPGNKIVNKAKDWITTFFLGANISSAIVEQLQPLQALPWQFVNEGRGVGESHRLVGKAYKDVANAYISDKIADPLTDRIVSQMEDQGLLEQTIGYTMDHDDLNGINLSRAVDGNKPLDFARAAGDKLSHIPAVMKNLYGRASGVSARVTTFAAVENAKLLVSEGKLEPDKIFDYVRNIVTLTAPGTAGRAGKAPWTQTSAIGVLNSLQGYTTSMYSMFARLAGDAVRSKSLTSSQSKAFMGMVTTNFLLAGVTGLAGAGLALNIANSAAPSLRLKERLREGVTNLLGDDKGNGSFFSDVALRGLPSAVTGIDFSSRLSLANMLGVSDYDGFQLGQLLGAPGSVLSNMYNASQYVQQGQLGEAVATAAPTAIKNVLRVALNQGDVRKPDGSLVYEPNTAEQFAMLIGFTPKKVADMREFTHLAAQQEKSASNEQQRFLSRTANLLRDGDLSGVRSALLEREHANPDEFSAAEGLKLVVRQMQDQTYPEDPRRGGSKLTLNDRADLLRTYGPSGVAPSESARLQQSSQIMQQFGLVGSLDQSDIMKAGYVDLLMQKNPQMTRQQARKKVEEMTRRKPLPTLGGF